MVSKIGHIKALGLIAILVVIIYTAQPQHLNFHWPIKKQAQVVSTISKTPMAAATPVAASPVAITPLPQSPQPPVVSGKNEFVPVLMYHHVADLTAEQRQQDPEGSDLTVSTADFENEVNFLHTAGYQSISIAQLYASFSNNFTLPPHPVVFTFDDGYADVFENAVPTLEQYGYTGSFGIITNKVGTADYAGWDQIIAADKQGMEIVSHTENHPDLASSKYTDDELHDEIFGSKQVLEQALGHPIDFFVYPYGDYNAHVEDLLNQAGYKMSFTTAFGLYQNSNNLLAEPRVRVHGIESLDKFKLSLGLRIAPAPTNP